MRDRLALLCALTLGLAVVFGSGWVRTAQAGDDDATKQSAVERLTPAEVKAIRARLSKPWLEYSESQRERIARGVLRLRDLTPDQRKRLGRRIERLKQEQAAGRDVRKDLDRYRKMRGDHRRVFQIAAKLGKGAGQIAGERLSKDNRQALRKFGVRSDKINSAFQHHLMVKIVADIEKNENVLTLSVDALPEQLRTAYEAMRTKVATLAAESPERKRAERRLAYMVLGHRMQAVYTSVKRPVFTRPTTDAPQPRDRNAQREAVQAYYTQLGAAVETTWPGPFESTVLELQKVAASAAAGNPQDVVKWVWSSRGRGRSDRSRGPSWFHPLRMLAYHLRGLEPDDALRTNLQALIKGMLVREAKADPAVVDAALAEPSFRRRWERLEKLAGIKRSSGRDEKRGAGWRPGSGRRPGGRPGKKAPGGGPGK